MKVRQEFIKLLQEPSEIVQGILGEGYLESLAMGQGMVRGAMLLTDKRLYFFGKGYGHYRGGGGLIMARQDSVIRVEDIQGTHYVRVSNLLAKIVAGIAVVLLLPFILFGGEEVAIGAMFVGFVVVGLAAIRILLGGSRVFMVDYGHGEKLVVPARWYPESTIHGFQRQVSRIVDDARGADSGRPRTGTAEGATVPRDGGKVCPFCAEDIKLAALKCKHCGSAVECSLHSGLPAVARCAACGRLMCKACGAGHGDQARPTCVQCS